MQLLAANERRQVQELDRARREIERQMIHANQVWREHDQYKSFVDCSQLGRDSTRVSTEYGTLIIWPQEVFCTSSSMLHGT